MVLLLYYKIKLIAFMTHAIVFSLLWGTLTTETILCMSAAVCAMDLVGVGLNENDE